MRGRACPCRAHVCQRHSRLAPSYREPSHPAGGQREAPQWRHLACLAWPTCAPVDAGRCFAHKPDGVTQLITCASHVPLLGSALCTSKLDWAHAFGSFGILAGHALCLPARTRVIRRALLCFDSGARHLANACPHSTRGELVGRTPARGFPLCSIARAPPWSWQHAARGNKQPLVPGRRAEHPALTLFARG